MTLEELVRRVEALEKAVYELPDQSDIPISYKGFTLSLVKGHYYTLKRREGDAVYTIYVGKLWSEDRADAAIEKWEAKQCKKQEL